MKKQFLAILLILSPHLFANEIDKSTLPVDEKSFIEAISSFNKDEILKALGEPASKEDIKIKSSDQVVGSVWQYHHIFCFLGLSVCGTPCSGMRGGKPLKIRHNSYPILTF